MRTLPLVGDAPELDQIAPWLNDQAQNDLPWWIASVNRPAATRLLDWLHEHRPSDRITLLASGDLPLEVRLPRPDMVGIDRLVDAVAVNRLRDASRPAVIVDVGTAITVDLVSADGAFLGGAILPGLQMAALRGTSSPICCRWWMPPTWTRRRRPSALPPCPLCSPDCFGAPSALSRN